MGVTERLLAKYPIISEQVEAAELRLILSELEGLLAVGKQGGVVEFGCYAGTTSLFIRRLGEAYDFTGEFHVYDSFEGLPAKVSQDKSPVGEQFREGELMVSRKTFVTNFKKAGLRLPVIHKGWFTDLTPESIPDNIMFAFLDGDYYQSIRDSLRLIEDRLTDDAVIVIDDYVNEALPGAARAVDEWLARHPTYRRRVQASLAIIKQR